MCGKDRLTKFYWFCFGVWMNLPRYVLLWTATEDILAGSLHSTAIVLIVFTVPDIFSKAFVSPWIVNRISFLPAFILYSALIVGIQMMFVFVNDVKARLAAMCVLGAANGLGKIILAKLLGFYRESAGVYPSGDNSATAFASISYTGLTTWVCVSPRMAIAFLTPFSLLPLLLYVLLDKEPLRDKKETSKNFTYKPVEYDDSKLQTVSQNGNKKSGRRSIGGQLKQLSKYFLVIYCSGAQNFTLQLSITAILPTVTFQSSPFPPRDHYQYYRFLSDFGLMLGGMELSLVSFLCPGFLDTIKIRRIWIVIVLNICNVMVFLSVSWFRYIESVYVIFILCFTLGVASGVVYVHCLSLSADLFHDSRKLGTVLGYLEVSISVGRLLAALLGMFLEKYLREHCTERLLMGKYCLARLPSPVMWTTSNCAN